MSVNGVNNINVPKMYTPNIADKSLPEQKVEPKKDGGKKLALALCGLAAIGAATAGIICAVKKHKLPDNLNLDAFKKAGGKFEKGKAFINGKAYTGMIEVPQGGMGKTVIEYSEGVLKSSTELEKISAAGTPLDGTFSEVSKKVYSKKDGASIIEHFKNKKFMAEDGKLATGWVSKGKTTITADKVTRTKPALIGETTRIAERQADGSWKRTLTRNISDAKNPKIYNTVTKDLNTGEILSSTEHAFSVPETKTNFTPEQQEVFNI